jgi:hypothetical protein
MAKIRNIWFELTEEQFAIYIQFKEICKNSGLAVTKVLPLIAVIEMEKVVSGKEKLRKFVKV